MNDTTISNWRSLSDKLTPEQLRHLEADERLAIEALESTESHTRATGRETLDMLRGEAEFYAKHNTPVGIELGGVVELFRTVIRAVQPSDLNRSDVRVLLGLLQGWSGWIEPKTAGDDTEANQ